MDEALLVTNLHVIGEGRKFAIEHSSGKSLQVLGLHAFDRLHDLAVVRVRADPSLHRLPIAVQEAGQGARVVAMGNPLGFRFSVVEGVVSGRREIEDRRMLQLAMPIEPGNSGGPVVNRRGEVLGVVTMKSANSNNLGFAIEVAALRNLLLTPNPVTLDRWRALAALDTEQWSNVFGGNWREAGGKILVSDPGQGFGGRTLCLRQGDPPEAPFEVGVWVKLNDEAGAAGLAFHSDGRHQHYGFYPSNGDLRLTRFQGPTVYNWTVLRNESSAAYRQGQWNYLKVRVAADSLQCFVNDELIIESNDAQFKSGRIGLVKFRDTEAEFRDFQVAATLPRSGLDAPARQRLDAWIAKLPEFSSLRRHDLNLETDTSALEAATRLREQADQLQQRATELQRMARQVHVDSVCRQLAAVRQEADSDLLQAALVLARLDYPDLNVEAYQRSVDRMAHELQQTTAGDASAEDKLAALDHYLFRESGFHGSRHDYDNAANSYMNLVIDDREGLPITLAVLYMSLAKRMGVTLQGVGLPGRFVVRHAAPDQDEEWIDVFAGGGRLAREDLQRLVKEHAGIDLAPHHLQALSNDEILIRILRNLLGSAETSSNRERMLGCLDALLTLAPESHQDRGVRAMVRFEFGRHEAAIEDLDQLLDAKPPGIDLNRVAELRDMFQRRKK